MNAVQKSRKSLIWTVAVAIAIFGAVWMWRSDGKAEKATFETEEVARGDLKETVSATGALQAIQTVSVGTQVSGTIDKLYVDFNSKVKQGALLALIDPSVLDSQLESSRALLSQATARYGDAVSALEEGQRLLAQKYISDREIRTLKVNVTTTKAQLDSAQADHERAKRNRQYAEIRSPIDGVVIERAVDRGQTVAAGFQTPTLFTIAEDLKSMQIVASVDESQIGSVKLDQAASFAVSAFPGKKFTASVRQIRLKPTVTQNVVTYAVVLNADNSTGELFPGMTATVDFVLKDLIDVLRVPSAALRVQRIPEEFMDAESLKRMQERTSGQPAGAGARPGNGEGGAPTPEQMQAFRQRMAQSGGAGRAAMGGVWVLQADGKATRVPVRVLGSDMSATAVETVRGELKPGDKVITKVVNAAAAPGGSATRSLLPGPPGQGPRR
ncbi:MAG: efflux RND transporter periplasmic adaptor subunit [Candidatus Obscuribacterales bacterium]|nr:efflux RND transporter periplasmic adaptor subunit [Steroidobacteraceae bacterium]